MGRPSKSVIVSKKEIGQRLRNIRAQKGVTQKDLAAILGTNQSHVSNVERGDRGITVQQLVKIARALKISTDHVLGEDAPASGNGHTLDPRLVRRLEKIQKLPPKQRRSLLNTVDTFLKGAGVH